MDIQYQYLDISQCEKHLTYLVLIYKYSVVISKIFILTYFDILDIVKLSVQILQLNI